MTIRVLHVVGAMNRAGAETMIMNLYRSIDRDRIQFDFLVHEERECDYDEEILDLGGTISRIPRFTGINFSAYAKASKEAIGACGDPIVHGHIGSSAAIYLSQAKKMGKTTIAHSHAQNYPLSLEEIAFRALSFPTRYIADEFVACSQGAGADRFGTRVVASDRFRVLANGIPVESYRCTDEEHAAAKKALGIDGGLVVGHVGRLTAVKNHDFLLRVFKEIALEDPSAHLLLYGKGGQEVKLRELATSLGIDRQVRFCGLTDDVPKALKALDVMVFPSFREGLAMAVVEAQAAGVPCVISEGVPPEAVLSDRIIRLPLSEDLEAWAKTAVVLARGVAGREEGADLVKASGFDVATSAIWLADFYEDLASRVVSQGGSVAK